jgi:hypothetical protein
MWHLVQGLLAAIAVSVIILFSSLSGCVSEVWSQAPERHFGLDPIGQSIVRDREENLNQERRIRLLERQVAQLQRIVFNDPTIRPPSYQEVVPEGPKNVLPIDRERPIGMSGETESK